MSHRKDASDALAAGISFTRRRHSSAPTSRRSRNLSLKPVLGTARIDDVELATLEEIGYFNHQAPLTAPAATSPPAWFEAARCAASLILISAISHQPDRAIPALAAVGVLTGYQRTRKAPTGVAQRREGSRRVSRGRAGQRQIRR